MMLKVNVLAKSAIAILAVVVLVALVGYISTNDAALLEFVKSAFGWVIIGIIIITLLINAPRLLKTFR